jgi:hypothetical protein
MSRSTRSVVLIVLFLHPCISRIFSPSGLILHLVVRPFIVLCTKLRTAQTTFVNFQKKPELSLNLSCHFFHIQQGDFSSLLASSLLQFYFPFLGFNRPPWRASIEHRVDLFILQVKQLLFHDAH